MAFRQRLIAHDVDRRLIERTLEVAQAQGGFSPRALRAALDSSPLWGAGRVEDTVNLLGHALRKAVSVIARQQGRGLAEVAAEAGAELVGGPMSLKAALDLDWDDPAALPAGAAGGAGGAGGGGGLAGGPRAPAEAADPVVAASREAAQQVWTQDMELASDGMPGPAARRQPRPAHQSGGCADAAWPQEPAGAHRWLQAPCAAGSGLGLGLRGRAHPRQCSRSQRHRRARRRLGSPAAQGGRAGRTAYRPGVLEQCLGADPPGHTADLLQGLAGAQPRRSASPRRAFTLDWDRQILRCPHHVELPFTLGGTVHFPAASCAACPLRPQCTSSLHGRSVRIHPDEPLLAELRARQQTPLGRAKLRERVGVEHTLAHVGHWQGRRARYRGLRKNLFDLRRCAVVHNLHVMARLEALSQAA